MEPPSKKPKVDEAALMQSLGDHLQSQKDSIDQHTKALKVSMRMLLNSDATVESLWRDFPKELRHNPVCVVEALESRKGRKSADVASLGPPFIQKSDIPAEMLESNRVVELAALKSRLLTWEEVQPTPEERRESKTLSVVALFRGGLILNLRDDAPLLTQGEVRELLHNQMINWEKVPTDLKDDLEFCRSIALIPEESSSYLHEVPKPLACHILKRHISFRVDETFWRMLVTEYPHKFGLRRLFHFAPAPLIAGPEFIKQACEKDDFVLAEIPTTNLVLEIVSSDPKKLGCVSYDFVRTYQDFVVSQLGAFSRSLSGSDFNYASHLFQNTSTTMLNDEAFSTAWLQAGLPMDEDPPMEWATDRAKLLLLAEHCRHSLWKVTSFRFASKELLDDADFIKAAMTVDPRIFAAASQHLKRTNFELAVWALSESDHYAKRPRHCWGRGMMENHRLQACEEIDMHDAFVNAFLTAVCDKKRSSALSSLDEDRVKSLIADFAGIRRKDTLRHIRGALANFARYWGD